MSILLGFILGIIAILIIEKIKDSRS